MGQDAVGWDGRGEAGLDGTRRDGIGWDGTVCGMGGLERKGMVGMG